MTSTATLSDLPFKREPLVSNSVLGMVVFILTEVMLFGAFISAYSIVTAGATEWPPADQPRLPIQSTALNTGFLFLSGIFLFLSNRTFSKNLDKTKKMLLASLILGTLFVLLQGVEWVRLITYGLTMTSSVYGSFFYLIIGTHAIHAVVSLFFLLVMYRRLVRGGLEKSSFVATQLFWYFVVLVWPVLYGLVYFN